MIRLFVYGTLKRGERNNHRLVGGVFRGEATTAARYAVIDLGSHPGLVAGDLTVRGELWELPLASLPALDAFEGVPDPFARRPVELADGRTAEAYFWLGTADGERLADWGDS